MENTKPTVDEIIDSAEAAVDVLVGVLDDMPTCMSDLIGDEGMGTLRKFWENVQNYRKSEG